MNHKTKTPKENEPPSKLWNRVFIADGEHVDYLDGLTQEQIVELIYGFKKKK